MLIGYLFLKCGWLGCYMWWYVGHSGLQCFNSGTWINIYYRWAGTEEVAEFMEAEQETPWTVIEIRASPCATVSATDRAADIN